MRIIGPCQARLSLAIIKCKLGTLAGHPIAGDIRFP
jgi:hypothetical protein